jgi:hypothetical protein
MVHRSLANNNIYFRLRLLQFSKVYTSYIAKNYNCTQKQYVAKKLLFCIDILFLTNQQCVQGKYFA